MNSSELTFKLVEGSKCPFYEIGDEFKLSGFSQTGSVYNLFNYAWVGLFVLYLVFGGWWVIRQYNEQQYMGGIQ